MDVFEDPISFEVMEEAVISIKCGHSFSHKTITAWLNTQPNCPICKTDMTKSDLNPNFKLREAIEQYLLQKKTGTISQIEDMTIVELLKNNEAEAAQIYARAFQHDPWFEYFLGKNHTENRAVLWFCSIIVRYSIQYGRVWGKLEKRIPLKRYLG